MASAGKSKLHRFRGFSTNRIAIIEAAVIGLFAGLFACVLEYGVNWLGTIRIQASIDADLPRQAVLATFGAVAGLVAGILVQLFGPEASGSGIPQVKAALLRAPVALNLPTAMAKLIGGTIALGSGLLMGREGPTVHVGAAIANQLNKTFPTAPVRRRQIIAAGAGAGLAAAFNAPIAGVMFVLEELLKNISSMTVGTAVLACFVASVVAHQFGAHRRIDYFQNVSHGASINIQDIPMYIVLGAACGLLGALFNKLLITSIRLNQKSGLPVWVRVSMAGAASGVIVGFLPPAMSDYALARNIIVSGNLPLDTSATCLIIFFLLTLIAYSSGAPGGLFAPALLMGTATGCILGAINQSVVGTNASSTFALVGMGGMFCSVARVPVTAIVIIFEMTRNFDLVLPLMIVCITAWAVGERLYPKSVYDRLMELAGLKPRGEMPISEEERKIKARDVVAMSTTAATTSTTPSPSTTPSQSTSTASADGEIGDAPNDDGKPLITVPEETELEDLLYYFDHFPIRRIGVTAHERLVATITEHDVIHALSRAAEAAKPSEAAKRAEETRATDESNLQ